MQPIIKYSNTCYDIWTRFYHRVRVLLLNTNFLKKFHKKQTRQMHAWFLVSATFEAEKLKYTQFHGNFFFAEYWFLVVERFWNTVLLSVNIEVFSILFQQICAKIQNYLLKLKVTILPDSNTANSMLRLTFARVNLFQNINPCLSWILVLRLTLMHSIQCWCSLFLF